MKKVLIALLAIILALVIGFSAGMIAQNGFSGFLAIFTGETDEPSMEGQVVTVGQNTANVYTKADVNSEVICSLSNGDTATCIKQGKDWLELEVIEGVTGYAHANLFSIAADYVPKTDTEPTAAEEQEAEAGPKYVTPKVNVLDIYAGESQDFEIVTTVEYGEILEVVKTGSEWYSVKTFSGEAGHVMAKDVTEADYDPEAMVVVVTNSYVNLRAEASSDSDKLGTLNRGEYAKYLGEVDNFYNVQLEDGTEAFLSMDYAELKNISELQSSTGDSSEQ